jgi:hypothetical protein
MPLGVPARAAAFSCRYFSNLLRRLGLDGFLGGSKIHRTNKNLFD